MRPHDSMSYAEGFAPLCVATTRPLTEASIADKLEEFRAAQPKFVSLR
jgi:hypothetical protein